MISISSKFSFEAAHHLPMYPGPCANVHGHSYKLKVGITSSTLDERCMVLDYRYLRAIVHDNVLALLDHKDLNTIFDMPTAEVMIEWVAKRLQAALPTDVLLEYVTLSETEDNAAEWTPEELVTLDCEV